MRIALMQMNSVLGDVAQNVKNMLLMAQQAKANGASLLVTPELALTGYHPEDLLQHTSFYEPIESAWLDLSGIKDVTWAVGHPALLADQSFNAVTVMRNGKQLGQYHKRQLADEGMLNEHCYFANGASHWVIEQDNKRVGLLIGQDIHSAQWIAEIAKAGADCVVVLDASTFCVDRHKARIDQLRQYALTYQMPIACVNAVGGQGEWVFHGASFAINRAGEVVAQAPWYTESLLILTMVDDDWEPSIITPVPQPIEAIYQALVLGVKDYVAKNHFSGALIGLSGGIDSALTLAIAVDALGADAVQTVMLPSIYTSDASVKDAKQMAARLSVSHHPINIWPIYEEIIHALKSDFLDQARDTTEENIQARIRGLLLMALSNKRGYLVLATGNKSELATGYCTLYGDMVGGFAVLKDVFKTTVYELAKWRNQQGEIIPTNIIERAPSAELKADQTDQDSLPPYEVLDAILMRFIERHQSIETIVRDGGFRYDDVNKVIGLLMANEYKRQQAPIGPNITSKAFGRNWHYPINHRFR